MLLEKADKCTYALLAKNWEWKGLKPGLSLHLFDHLISPILFYGCEFGTIMMGQKSKDYTYGFLNLH